MISTKGTTKIIPKKLMQIVKLSTMIGAVKRKIAISRDPGKSLGEGRMSRDALAVRGGPHPRG